MASRKEYSTRPARESLSKRLGKVARAIKARDGHACVYCGATAETSGSPLHLDHLTPRKAGGQDVASNLVLACRRCNCARHDMPLAPWLASRSTVNVWARTVAVRVQAARPLPLA